MDEGAEEGLEESVDRQVGGMKGVTLGRWQVGGTERHVMSWFWRSSKANGKTGGQDHLDSNSERS